MGSDRCEPIWSWMFRPGHNQGDIFYFGHVIPRFEAWNTAGFSISALYAYTICTSLMIIQKNCNFHVTWCSLVSYNSLWMLPKSSLCRVNEKMSFFSAKFGPFSLQHIIFHVKTWIWHSVFFLLQVIWWRLELENQNYMQICNTMYMLMFFKFWDIYSQNA